MWFLDNHLTKVSINALVISLPRSYQHTTLQFLAGSDKDSIRVCIPFPWDPSKNKDGGLNMVSSDLLQHLQLAENCSISGTTLPITDYKIYRKIHYIRNEINIDNSITSDLNNVYAWDDWGFLVATIPTNIWVEISYTHKISIDSTLFVPTRLPTILIYKKIPIDVNVFSIDSNYREAISGVKRSLCNDDANSIVKDSGYSTVDRYISTDDYTGDIDIDIFTQNWYSSDDDYSSDE